MIINKVNELRGEKDDSLLLLGNLSYKDVSNTIDDIFGNLNNKQKVFLKKLCKLVLWLAKNE